MSSPNEEMQAADGSEAEVQGHLRGIAAGLVSDRPVVVLCQNDADGIPPGATLITGFVERDETGDLRAGRPTSPDRP